MGKLKESKVDANGSRWYRVAECAVNDLALQVLLLQNSMMIV
jgi:hypothetical protein